MAKIVRTVVRVANPECSIRCKIMGMESWLNGDSLVLLAYFVDFLCAMADVEFSARELFVSKNERGACINYLLVIYYILWK